MSVVNRKNGDNSILANCSRQELQAYRLVVRRRKNPDAYDLSDDDVRKIRNDPRECIEIAKDYNLSRGYVAAIKRNEKRTDVPPSPVVRHRQGKKPDLTDDQVRAIRADPRGWDAIAKEYHIKPHMIGNVKSRYRYSRVSGPPSVRSPIGRPPRSSCG